MLEYLALQDCHIAAYRHEGWKSAIMYGQSKYKLINITVTPVFGAIFIIFMKIWFDKLVNTQLYYHK